MYIMAKTMYITATTSQTLSLLLGKTHCCSNHRNFQVLLKLFLFIHLTFNLHSPAKRFIQARSNFSQRTENIKRNQLLPTQKNMKKRWKAVCVQSTKNFLVSYLKSQTLPSIVAISDQTQKVISRVCRHWENILEHHEK